MRLNRRLKSLENRLAPPAQECRACGLPLLGTGPVEFKVGWWSQDDPPSPQTPYGRSKLKGEQVVMETPGLRWTILRPGVVYGPGDRALLPLFKLAGLGFLPLVGRPDAAYTFVHVHDVVRTIAAAIEAAPLDEVLFVGHARPVSGREILDAIGLVVGRPATVIPVPQAITRLAAVC